MAHGPNPTQHLFSHTEFFKNITMLIHLCIIYDCFHAIIAVVYLQEEPSSSPSLKYFLYGHLQKSSANSILD